MLCRIHASIIEGFTCLRFIQKPAALFSAYEIKLGKSFGDTIPCF
jgi:hypothetical protein